jgi:predicted HTH transcriptional regulator
VNRKGGLARQLVSEQTRHEITAALNRFEPPINVKSELITMTGEREVLVLRVESNREGVPLTFDGRAYERVGNTTRKMSQEQYETLLFERAHARRRWENQAAVDVRLTDLDLEEILRTRELAMRFCQNSPHQEIGSDSRPSWWFTFMLLPRRSGGSVYELCRGAVGAQAI